MIVYPAIDLRKGRCVRLIQGDATAETVFSQDPVEIALRWAAQGAEWLHIVNLDGALGEAGTANMTALERILQVVELPIQFGGGVRSLEDIARVLEKGVQRVILGTVAVRQPQIVREAIIRYGPERICVGIDARAGQVAIHGWVDTTPLTANMLAQKMAKLGVQRIIYTDVQRDGTLQGVNIAATLELARASGLQVIASGGVASLEDIRALCAHEKEGIEGVIVGMALYRGAIQLDEAIRIAQGG